MATLQQLFQQQQAGLTVYSPDCTRSRLWGNLDHEIVKATEFQPVYRQWVIHDINSILRFYRDPDDLEPAEQNPDDAAKKYDDIPAEKLQYGHLMVKLLLAGPSLLTIWQGDNAIETLLALRGKTHPAEAAPTSIRGRFWCDNATCNLLHVSDNQAEAERELKAVKLSHILEGEPVAVRLLDPVASPARYVAHSGILMVCELVNRLLIPMAETLEIKIPPSGDAKETNRLLAEILQATAARLPDTPIAEFINAYLAGDIVTITRLLKQIPVTRWEHFIIQCGAIARQKWASA